ncbi:FecR domain-containing protein [Candidatus Dependentiae bacterium]|nr:FecR domain-containing protein [Candidatus Dependentiae bacterium]
MNKKILLFCIIFFGMILVAEPQIFAAVKIFELDGEVKFQKSGTNQWKDAKINMELENSDKIKTLFSSSAIIKLPDGSNITIAENTVLNLDSVINKQNINVKVVFGGLKADVFKKKLTDKSEFKITTPTAVAGVRGTEFEVTEGSDGSKFLVLEGSVEIEANGKKVLLNKMEKVQVTSGGKINEKEKARENETMLELTDRIKEKLVDVKKEKELLEKQSETKPSEGEGKDTETIDTGTRKLEDIKDTTPKSGLKEDTKNLEFKISTDTKPAQKPEFTGHGDTKIIEKPDHARSSEDTKLVETGRHIPDTKTVQPAAPIITPSSEKPVSDTKPVRPVPITEPPKPTTPTVPAEPSEPQSSLPPATPVITEPQDNITVYSNRVTVSGNSDKDLTIILKINNSQVSTIKSSGDFTFSNISMREGSNKISVTAKNSKGLLSPEASINITSIVSMPAPQITSPAPGSNFDRGPAPIINLTGWDNAEWTNKNPLNISGKISFNNTLNIPDIKGKWLTNQGKGIEGDISLIIKADNDEFEYSSRSDASGNFNLSGVSINLPDDKFTCKTNSEEAMISGGNLQYNWIMEQGQNKLNIEALEKSITISIKVRGKNIEGIESPEAVFSYSSQGKNSSISKDKKLDSLEPIIGAASSVTDDLIRITTRDPEPTSGVYKVTVDGILLKRVEGTEKDSEQVWEGNIKIIKPNLPPPPPDRPAGYTKKQNVKVKVTDRSENSKEQNVELIIFFQ